ncbi:MAG: cache domain-containing protein [Burkholderiales bacterium]|nr:cache domain-containing protein [Burkholderiales bacterium]
MSAPLDNLVNRIMLPCSLVMSRLGLRTKLLSMFATLMLPMVILAVHLIIKDHEDVGVANKELNGVVVMRQLTNVMLQTQKHRGQMNLKLAGQDIDEALSKTSSDLIASLDKLDQSIKENPDFNLASAWQAIGSDIRQLISSTATTSAADSFKQHTQLIEQILTFSALINEKSGLLFDPEAATYLLMDISSQKMPAWIEHMAVLRGIGAGLIKSGSIELDGKLKVNSRIDALQVDYNSVTAMEDALKRAGESISTEQQAAIEASKNFSELARKNLLGESVNGDGNTFFNQGTAAIESTVALQRKLQDRLSLLLQERVDHKTFLRNMMLTVMLLGLLLTSYLVFGFYRGFIRALGEVSRSAHSVASGDLTNQIHIVGKDELADTGNTLEQMNFNLSGLVANVRTNASMVSQLGRQLANGISDLSVRTEQQASSLEQTSASVEDLADTVRQNAESARAVDNLASNVRMIAESSGDTMRSAVDSMHGIQSSALKVQEIISIIDAIAFQTNILALNAAVEAARAGEQGRGFAVVATEVRGLAQRSADSARQIRHLIDDSVQKVENGVTQINDVNVTLEEIVKGIRDLASNINEISVASTEQSNGLAQISEALRHLDEITQSNGQMADQAKHSSINLEERATALAKAVSTFKLRQGTADEAYALTKRAISLYKKQGRTALQTITANQDKLYADRDMYVFAFDQRGQYLAFGGNAEKLKVNLFNVSGLDGRKLVREAFELPATGGWVDYSIVNPVSQKVENKTSYMEKVTDDIVIGCGVYKIV